MMGGISKLKYHLSKIHCHDVGICLQASIHVKDRKKEEAAANKAERTIRSLELSTTKCSGRASTDSPTKKSSYFFVPRTRVGAQPSIMSMLKNGRRQK